VYKNDSVKKHVRDKFTIYIVARRVSINEPAIIYTALVKTGHLYFLFIWNSFIYICFLLLIGIIRMSLRNS